jgi:hypothetical protein
LTRRGGVGGRQINFRDLSRNLMARDKVLYTDHAVATLYPKNYIGARKAAREWPLAQA